MPLQTSVKAAQVAAVHALLLAGVRLTQASVAVGVSWDRMRRFVVPGYVVRGNFKGLRPRSAEFLAAVQADFEQGVRVDDIARRHRISAKRVKVLVERYGWQRLVPRAKKWVAPDRPPPPVPKAARPIPDYATDTVALVTLPLGPKIRPLDVIVAPQSMLGILGPTRLYGQKTGASAHRGGA